MHIQNICHLSSMPNIPEINTAMIPRGELLFAIVYSRSKQCNGKLSKRAQVRSTWKINQHRYLSLYKTSAGAPGLGQYQTTQEWHTWDWNPHPLTPSSRSPKCQPQLWNDDSVSSWVPFLLYCHTLFKTVIPDLLFFFCMFHLKSLTLNTSPLSTWAFTSVTRSKAFDSHLYYHC